MVQQVTVGKTADLHHGGYFDRMIEEFVEATVEDLTEHGVGTYPDGAYHEDEFNASAQDVVEAARIPYRQAAAIIAYGEFEPQSYSAFDVPANENPFPDIRAAANTVLFQEIVQFAGQHGYVPTEN